MQTRPPTRWQGAWRVVTAYYGLCLMVTPSAMALEQVLAPRPKAGERWRVTDHVSCEVRGSGHTLSKESGQRSAETAFPARSSTLDVERMVELAQTAVPGEMHGRVTFTVAKNGQGGDALSLQGRTFDLRVAQPCDPRSVLSGGEEADRAALSGDRLAALLCNLGGTLARRAADGWRLSPQGWEGFGGRFVASTTPELSCQAVAETPSEMELACSPLRQQPGSELAVHLRIAFAEGSDEAQSTTLHFVATDTVSHEAADPSNVVETQVVRECTVESAQAMVVDVPGGP